MPNDTFNDELTRRRERERKREIEIKRERVRESESRLDFFSDVRYRSSSSTWKKIKR